MMQTVTVSTKKEAMEQLDEHTPLGQHFSAASNTGLPLGKLRLTFLPTSAFQSGFDAQENDRAARAFFEAFYDALDEQTAFMNKEAANANG